MQHAVIWASWGGLAWRGLRVWEAASPSKPCARLVFVGFGLVPSLLRCPAVGFVTNKVTIVVLTLLCPACMIG